MTTKKETVRIHNKDYETVASRVNRFRQHDEHKNLAIRTELILADENYVIIKASIVDIVKNADEATIGEFVLATGYAEEKRNSTNINKTSALENAETSAIGRALAAFGYAGTEYASADEVANAISQQAKSASTKAPALPPVENVDDETFQKLCFLGSKLDLSKEQSKKLWDNIRTTHGWTRGRYNAETKKWQGTRIPAEAIRYIVELFAGQAGHDVSVLLADFGLDALSDSIYSEDLSQFSDEIF